MSANPTIRTFTGRTIDMLAPRPEDIDLRDIARGLAWQCRFNGHVTGFASIAEHSVRVAYIVLHGQHDEALVRAGLLHDAAEAYVGDLVGPAKKALRTLAGGSSSAFDELERRWLRAIGRRFGLGNGLVKLPSVVKAADVRALAVEDHHHRGLPLAWEPTWRDQCLHLPPPAAERVFLVTCEELGVR